MKLRTQAKLKRIAENRAYILNRIQRNKDFSSDKRKEELQQMIEVCDERTASLKNLLLGTDNESINNRRNKSVRRIALSLTEKWRMKRRRPGAGAKRKMTEEEEQFVAECIEEKASIHGRRSEGVLFYNKRIKQKDLLSLVNCKRMKMGKTLLKSATTVLNGARPRNKRTLQAKRHSVGKWLFCSKAPPKTDIHLKIHTRHQRQARKLLKIDAWSSKQSDVNKLYLYVSKDDKAYLRPGTSSKFNSILNLKTLNMILVFYIQWYIAK